MSLRLDQNANDAMRIRRNWQRIAKGNAAGIYNVIAPITGGSTGIGLAIALPLIVSGNALTLPLATSTANGYLSSTDWTTFNNKLSGGSFMAGSTTLATTAPLAGGGTISTGLTLSMPAASATLNGYLTSTDWTTFNGKQPAGSYVTTARVLNTTTPLAGGGDLSADRTFSIIQASATLSGFLSSTDWNTFNNKSNTVGTVTSVGLSLPGIFTVSGSPVTTSGTLSANLATQGSTQVFIGPASGANAAPTFRILASTDIPTLNESQISGLTTDLAGKVPTSRLVSTSAPLAGGGDLSADRTLSIPVATSTANGYLSSTDWTTFNNKGSGGGGGITALYSSTGSAAISSTSTKTNFNLSFASSTGALNVANRTIRWTCYFSIKDTNSVSDTLTLIAALGSVSIATSGAMKTGGLAAGSPAILELVQTTLTTGSTGTVQTAGMLRVNGIVYVVPLTTTATVVDLTAAITLQVSATWSAVSANCSVTLDQILLEQLA